MIARLPLALFFASAMACMPATADQKDDEIAELREQVKQLRSENQGLRLQLGQARGQAGQDSGQAPAAEAPEKSRRTEPSAQQAEQTCWITSSSSKRHNSSCRYYKNSKGRVCAKDEGIPCKICGG